MGDLVWLHSPVPKQGSCCKLHHPWTGPFKVIKQLTYHIQHDNQQHKVVHFNRLKPCTNGVIHTYNPQMGTHNYVSPMDNAVINLPSGGGRGGLEGLEPPNFPERGAEPLQKYMCVTSSTSREQYCFKWYS